MQVSVRMSQEVENTLMITTVCTVSDTARSHGYLQLSLIIEKDFRSDPACSDRFGKDCKGCCSEAEYAGLAVQYHRSVRCDHNGWPGFVLFPRISRTMTDSYRYEVFFTDSRDYRR